MQTILITGGSRGIGAAMVRRFSQAGYRVAFGWHQSGGAAAALARETGALPLCADLRNEAAVDAFVAAAMAQLSHLDALIVNAGTTWSGLVTDMRTAQWDSLMALNLKSAFLLSRAVLPGMRQRGKGSILFLSSFQGITGASCEAAYATSKAGLHGLCRSLAAEWGPSGIRVNCLAPGVIDTDMMAGYSEAEREALKADIPLHRLGTAMEVAQAAHFLVSDDARYITGQVLSVDGGMAL